MGVAAVPTIFLVFTASSKQITAQDGSRVIPNIAGATTGLKSFSSTLKSCKSASTGDWANAIDCGILVSASTIATGVCVYRYLSTGSAF